MELYDVVLVPHLVHFFFEFLHLTLRHISQSQESFVSSGLSWLS